LSEERGNPILFLRHGDGVSFDERMPENISLAGGVWIAAVSGATAKPIGPVSKKIVDHEFLVKGDFETGSSIGKLPQPGSGKTGGG